jgi:cell division septal protein FtsQ
MLARLTALIAGLGIVAGGATVAGMSSATPLRHVRVLGASELTEAHLSEWLKPALPRAISELHPAEFRAALMAAFPYESVSVSRQWPDRLVIEVEERTPYAMLLDEDGQISLIDAGGRLVSLRHDQGISLWDRPVIRGCGKLDDPHGTYDCAVLAVGFLAWLDMTEPTWIRELSEIEVSGDSIAVVLNDGLRILFGRQPFGPKLRNLRFGWAMAQRHDLAVRTIILTNPNQVIFDTSPTPNAGATSNPRAAGRRNDEA